MNLISKFYSPSRALQSTKNTWHKTKLKNISCQSSVKLSTFYSSSLPESYYNEKQKEIQQTTAKVDLKLKTHAHKNQISKQHQKIEMYNNNNMFLS